MLRVVVLTLVLVNLVLLAVQLLEQPEVRRAAPPAVPARSDDMATIRLLSEVEDPAPPSGTAECFTAGPFTSPAETAAALRIIAPSAVAISQRQTEALSLRGTWVYLPVQPDYVTARNMALTLRDAGFSDARVVMDGDWKYSVSLGFFADRANAQARHDEARSLGFEVELRGETERQARYWIDYEQRTGAPYVRPGAEAVIRDEQHRTIPCAPEATPGSGSGDAARKESPEQARPAETR